MSEYTYHLAKHFSTDQRVSKVTVLADKSEGDPDHDTKVEVLRCWKLNDPLTLIRVIFRIAILKPDIVHFDLQFRFFSKNRFINLAGLSAPAFSRLLNFPTVITLHSIADVIDLEEAGYAYSLANTVGCMIATRLLLMANVITVTHKRIAHVLKRKYRGKNVFHLAHGIIAERHSQPEFSGKRLLLFGKVGPYKNPTILLDAFKQVFGKDRNVELMIAGPPHPFHQEFLQNLLEQYGDMPNVKVVGYVPEDQLELIFAEATVVVLPYSITTWSSGTFVLASGFGRPVIASDLPDFRELRDEGAGVILFPRGNEQALVKAITQVLNDVKLQRKLGEANLEWANKHPFNGTSSALIDLFQQLLGRNHDSPSIS